MDDHESVIRRESLAWLVATVLVALLAAYGTALRTRQNARLGEEMRAAEQTAPARPGSTRAP